MKRMILMSAVAGLVLALLAGALYYQHRENAKAAQRKYTDTVLIRANQLYWSYMLYAPDAKWMPEALDDIFVKVSAGARYVAPDEYWATPESARSQWIQALKSEFTYFGQGLPRSVATSSSARGIVVIATARYIDVPLRSGWLRDVRLVVTADGHDAWVSRNDWEPVWSRSQALRESLLHDRNDSEAVGVGGHGDGPTTR